MIDPGCKPKPNGAKQSKSAKTCHTTEFDVIEYAPRPAMNYEPILPLTGLMLIKYLPIDLRNLGVDNVVMRQLYSIAFGFTYYFQRLHVIRFCPITKTYWLCTSIKCGHTYIRHVPCGFKHKCSVIWTGINLLFPFAVLSQSKVNTSIPPTRRDNGI
jgi:hypothetical protein